MHTCYEKSSGHMTRIDQYLISDGLLIDSITSITSVCVWLTNQFSYRKTLQKYHQNWEWIVAFSKIVCFTLTRQHPPMSPHTYGCLLLISKTQHLWSICTVIIYGQQKENRFRYKQHLQVIFTFTYEVGGFIRGFTMYNRDCWYWKATTAIPPHLDQFNQDRINNAVPVCSFNGDGYSQITTWLRGWVERIDKSKT